MANTRQYDRIIHICEKQLAAVERRELSALSGRERRTIVAALAVGGAKVTRRKGTSRQDRTVETTWANAEARLRAEISAAEKAKQRHIEETAAAKTTRRTSRWW